MFAGWLLEWDTEGLGAHRRGLSILLLAIHSLSSGAVLNVVLALHDTAPRHEDEVLLVEGWDKVFPLGNLDDVGVEEVLGLGVHVLLDGVESGGDGGLEVVEGDGELLTVVTAGGNDLLLLGIGWAKLETEWDTLELPVVELVAWGVRLTEIGLDAEARLLKAFGDGVNLVEEGFTLVLGNLVVETAWDNDDLEVGDAWWEDETLVVTVNHDHDTNDTGGETPRVLPDKERILLLTLLGSWVLDSDVEHLGEVLTQAMGSGALDTTSSGWNVTLDGGGEKTSGELFLLSLLSLDGWDGEELRVNVRVVLENLHDFVLGILSVQVSGVTLLPQELSGTEEWLWVLELPSDDRVPLVESERQVSVRADPLGVVWVHDGLGGWTDSDWLIEVLVTTASVSKTQIATHL